MKTLGFLLLIVLCLLAYSVLAQNPNLVPNPSFEFYDSLPNDDSQIGRATGWNACSNTPDYFHGASPSGNVSIPQNYFGTVELSGNEEVGCAGFYAKHPSHYCEVVGRKLASPLISGVTYYVSFYVSRAEKISNCGVDHIGVLFTDYFFGDTVHGCVIVDNPPQVQDFAHVYSEEIIIDTLEWTKISGSFTPREIYRFIYIGNFFHVPNMEIVSEPQDTCIAYYYLDNVCVSTDPEVCGVVASVQKREAAKHPPLWPNPFQDNLYIRDAGVPATLCSVLGQELRHWEVIPSEIDFSDFERGVYFLKTEKEVFKLIKQ